MQEPSSPSNKSSNKTISSMIISINAEEEDPFYGEDNISDSSHDSKISQKYIKPPEIQMEIRKQQDPLEIPEIEIETTPKVHDKPMKTTFENTKTLLEKTKISSEKPQNLYEKSKSSFEKTNEMIEKLEIKEKKHSEKKWQADFSMYRNIIWKKSRHSDEDICDICNNSEIQELDSIYICDLCNCTAHQSCYGSELLERNSVTDPNGIYLRFLIINFKIY